MVYDKKLTFFAGEDETEEEGEEGEKTGETEETEDTDEVTSDEVEDDFEE